MEKHYQVDAETWFRTLTLERLKKEELYYQKLLSDRRTHEYFEQMIPAYQRGLNMVQKIIKEKTNAAAATEQHSNK